MIENQFHITPKVIRTDNGSEFLLHDFYASKGILRQRSCVETPQQNGRVERKHQHILNIGRALLYQSKLPFSFWSYAFLHVVFLINRVPNLFFKTILLIIYFMILHLIFMLSRFLVAFVMLHPFKVTEPNLSQELESLSS